MANDDPRFPDEEKGFDITEVFSPDQVDNWVKGITRSKNGFLQGLTEAGEGLGLLDEGSTAYLTQELKKEMDLLDESTSFQGSKSGAGVHEFLGEALPLFTVPLGGSVSAAAALGAAASTGFWHDDPEDQSRLLDIGTGAALGGLFRKLLSGGQAANRAKGAIADAEIGPPELVGPRRPQSFHEMGPPELTGPRQPQVMLGEQATAMRRAGLTADDFQNAGRNPIPGFEGVPKPRQRVASSQGLAGKVQGTGTTLAEKAKAISRTQAFIKRIEDQLARAKAAVPKVKKPHMRLKLDKKITAMERARLAASTMARGIQGAAAKEHAAMLGKPRMTVPSDGSKPMIQGPPAVGQKPSVKGPAAVAQDVAKPLTRKEAIKAILAANPEAKGLSKYKVGELREMEEALRLGQAQAKAQAKAGAEAMDKFTLGGKRGKQGGFLNTDLQAMMSGAGVGAIAGGQGTDGSPAGIAAGAVGGALLGRLGGRALSKMTTPSQRQEMIEASKEGSEYVSKLSNNAKVKEYGAETIHAVLTDGRRTLDKFFGATMTRLEKLAPRVAVALKEAEWRQSLQSGDWISEGEGLFSRINAAGLTDIQQRNLKIAMLNSTTRAKHYLQKLGKTDAANAVDELDALMKAAGKYLNDVNLGGRVKKLKGGGTQWVSTLRANHFPRMVKETGYFDNIKEVETYLAQVAKKKGIDLTDFEKETEITKAINGAMNHGADDTHFARAADNLKKRTVKVEANNVDAYADLQEGFNDYIESITQQAERRRFFKGRGVKIDDIGDGAESMDTIGHRLTKSLKDGDIDADKVDEVTELLKMRFGPGEQAPARQVQNFKNLTYMGLLGNPLSAMTQFGDLALGAHRNGISNNTRAIMEGVAKRGKLMDLTKDGLLGIRNPAADFASKTRTRDVLNWSLKYSGFQAVDKFGKDTFIRGAMLKNQQKDLAAFRERWKHIFDPDNAQASPRTDNLFKQVQEFDGITPQNREDISFMLWNELEGVQPIAVSAFPEMYLKHPNGRMAYMLQSFTLKLFDVMRKDIFQKWARGDKKGAIKNAANLSTLFVMSNGGIDTAKDFMMGKELKPTDTVVNNYLKMLGMSKYMVDGIGKDGLGDTLLKQVAPPMALPNALGDSKKALQLVPIGGRVLEGLFRE